MKCTAKAGANIAFVKYWGNRSDDLRIPMNPSISMTLKGCSTVTTVALDNRIEADVVTFNGVPAAPEFASRIQTFLDLVRARAAREDKARIATVNSFPTGCGIASSASGFAALAAAAAEAYGLRCTPRDLSRLARRGSGSACRSIFGGFVEWTAGVSDESSYAIQLADETHWPELRDIIVLLSCEPKAVGSSEGHRLAHASPLYEARLAGLTQALEQTKRAVAARDLTALGDVLEREALCLHAIIMTARQPILYWAPQTIDVLHLVRASRREGLEAYFTLDAGANVHIITTRQAAPKLRTRLAERGYRELLVDQPGPGAQILADHLI